jgi:hypothetical protein
MQCDVRPLRCLPDAQKMRQDSLVSKMISVPVRTGPANACVMVGVGRVREEGGGAGYPVPLPAAQRSASPRCSGAVTCSWRGSEGGGLQAANTVTVAGYKAQLAAAGFVDISVEDITGVTIEPFLANLGRAFGKMVRGGQGVRGLMGGRGAGGGGACNVNTSPVCCVCGLAPQGGYFWLSSNDRAFYILMAIYGWGLRKSCEYVAVRARKP